MESTFNIVVYVTFMYNVRVKNSWNRLCFSGDKMVNPANNYLFKVNNRNITKRREIYSKLTKKIPNWRQWRSGVFIGTYFSPYCTFSIFDFEQVMVYWLSENILNCITGSPYCKCISINNIWRKIHQNPFVIQYALKWLSTANP